MVFTSFISGWIGGMIGCLASYPLDTAKTLQQLNPSRYRTVSTAMLSVVRAQGLRGIYRGSAAPVSGVGLIFAVCFGAYEAGQRTLTGIRSRGYGFLTIGNETSLVVDAAFCGGVAAVFSSLVQGPAELVKVRQQMTLQSSPGASSSSSSASVRAVVRSVCGKGRGVRGLLRGTPMTMMREVPGTAIWFAVYEGVRASFTEKGRQPAPAVSFMAGGVAGIAMWSVVMPVDVVKTIHQSRPYRCTPTEVAHSVYRRSGLGGFYRGLRPALMRAFVANAATFVARDAAVEHLSGGGTAHSSVGDVAVAGDDDVAVMSI